MALGGLLGQPAAQVGEVEVAQRCRPVGAGVAQHPLDVAAVGPHGVAERMTCSVRDATSA